MAQIVDDVAYGIDDVWLISISGDDMDNWLAKIVSDVYSLHVEIEK